MKLKKICFQKYFTKCWIGTQLTVWLCELKVLSQFRVPWQCPEKRRKWAFFTCHDTQNAVVPSFFSKWHYCLSLNWIWTQIKKFNGEFSSNSCSQLLPIELWTLIGHSFWKEMNWTDLQSNSLNCYAVMEGGSNCTILLRFAFNFLEY